MFISKHLNIEQCTTHHSFFFTSLKYDPFYVISIFHFLYSSTHISTYSHICIRNHLHIQNYNKKKSLGFICNHKETFVAKYVCAFPSQIHDTELCECCHKNYYLKTKNPKSFAQVFGITSTGILYYKNTIFLYAIHMRTQICYNMYI